MDDEVVRQAPLFAALDEEAAKALLATMTRVEVPRGEAVFHEGDPGDRLYVIVEGKIKLGRASGDGRENLLGRPRAGRDVRRAVASSTPGRATPPGRRWPTPCSSGWAATTSTPWLTRAAGGGPAPAPGAGPPAAPHQRGAGRPRLLRRARPRRQGPARPLRALRAADGRRPARRARPDPGGAGAAGRGLARDGQQGARRLRLPRLAAARGPRRRPASTSTASASAPASALSAGRAGSRAGRARSARRRATRSRGTSA